jgi:hypothetical protein
VRLDRPLDVLRLQIHYTAIVAVLFLVLGADGGQTQAKLGEEA